MTNEQRRALANATPTTDVIRDAVTFPRDRLGEPLDISPERFEAWLARVRRDAAREALDGLARESMGAFKSPQSPPDPRSWAEMSGAVEWYRDTHYPEETP